MTAKKKKTYHTFYAILSTSEALGEVCPNDMINFFSTENDARKQGWNFEDDGEECVVYGCRPVKSIITVISTQERPL